MNRINRKNLEAIAARINRTLNRPLEPYTRQADGRLRANIGNFHISGAYGGYCLHEMVNEDGGVRTPVAYGHIPARELADQMHAFLRGIEQASNPQA